MVYKYFGVVSGDGRDLILFSEETEASLRAEARHNLDYYTHICGYADVRVSELGLYCARCGGNQRIVVKTPKRGPRHYATCPECGGSGVAQHLPPCSTVTLEAASHG